ncbi:MAG: recombinase family protein [Aeromonas veronii]
MDKAIIYARFSSEQQSEGDSLRRQTERAEQFCKQRGLELSDLTFADLGISGWRSKKREGLENLIKQIECGKIAKGTHIVVEAVDRLSRRGFDHVFELVKRLVATGCKFAVVDTQTVYDSNTITDFPKALPLLFSAHLAKEESDRKSARLREVKTNKRKERVIQGNLPFWIDIVDGKPKLNKYAKLARRIVDMRLKGRSPPTIAKTLNLEGITTARGKDWGDATVRRVLDNTILYGAKTYYHSRDGEYKPVEVVAGLFPAICTFEEFDSMQSKKPKQGRKQSGPFSGLLKCSCGRCLVNKQMRYGSVYRVCSGKLIGVCNRDGYYRDPDLMLLRVLRDLKVARFTDGQIVGEVDATEVRIQELEQELINLEEMKKANRGKVAILQMVFESIVSATEELAELKNKPKPMNTDVDLLAIVNVEDVAEQNALFRGVIDRIECSKAGADTARYRVEFRNGFRTTFQVTHKRGSVSITILGDGQAVLDADATNELQPWELDQE